MNIFPLAIPLTAVFDVTNLGGSAFARESSFALGTSACLLSLLVSLLCQQLVVLAHGTGFPLADVPVQKLGTVGFPDVDPSTKR